MGEGEVQLPPIETAKGVEGVTYDPIGSKLPEVVAPAQVLQTQDILKPPRADEIPKPLIPPKPGEDQLDLEGTIINRRLQNIDRLPDDVPDNLEPKVSEASDHAVEFSKPEIQAQIEQLESQTEQATQSAENEFARKAYELHKKSIDWLNRKLDQVEAQDPINMAILTTGADVFGLVAGDAIGFAKAIATFRRNRLKGVALMIPVFFPGWHTGVAQAAIDALPIGKEIPKKTP